MSNNFQNVNLLKELYKDKDLIGLRGEFLKKYSNRRYSIRSFIVKYLLTDMKGFNIIDIGCGNGSFLNKLHGIYPKNNYYGLDIIENEYCRKFDFLNYKIYDGKDIPKYNIKFDFIFCMNMIYHIDDLKLFFSNVKQILKPKGKIIITTKSKYTFPVIEATFKKIALKMKLKTSRFRDENKLCLENGMKKINESFNPKKFNIKEYIMETQIFNDDKKELIKYILSTSRYNPNFANQKELLRYLNFWEEEIKDDIFIDKYKEVVFTISKL